MKTNCLYQNWQTLVASIRKLLIEAFYHIKAYMVQFYALIGQLEILRVFIDQK